MNSERNWRIAWASWAGAFVVLEGIALGTRLPFAPLSHHSRKALRAGETRAGSVVLAAGSVWLIHHLYKKAEAAS
jgi:hypothetical protein